MNELQRIVGKRRVVVREMIDNERYVGFNKKPLPLLGYIIVSVLVMGIRVSKARVLVARRGTKPVVGRDWLTALRCKSVHSLEEGWNPLKCVTEGKVKPDVELRAEVKQLKVEIPDLFERSGCVNIYSIKIDMKEGERVTQQKDRRIPIHLQEQVDREINSLSEKGHIERVDTLKDDVFTQSVVITVAEKIEGQEGEVSR